MIKFAKTHEWADINGNEATVGISTFAASELSDIAFIVLPEIGQEVVAGEKLCEVESVKSVEDIMAPVSGKVIEINEELESAPELINDDAMAAWICKIEVTAVPDDLMDEAEYEALEK